MIKANELRNMTADEIRLKIEGLKKELFNLRTIAAAGRIEKPHRISEIRKDVARCETVIREFYFAQQRNTDIMASMLMRRIMRERDLYTNYGPPMAYHARQPRPLLKDLQAERYGVDNIAAYADYLNRAPLPEGATVLESCRILAQGWNGPELEAAMAFYEDCEQVLK